MANQFGQEVPPTYWGMKADRGRLIPVLPHEGEGYAVLICGNTHVVLSYTVLHAMFGWLVVGALGNETTLNWRKICSDLASVICEASIGRIPPEEDCEQTD